jgi:hypothetical protein
MACSYCCKPGNIVQQQQQAAKLATPKRPSPVQHTIMNSCVSRAEPAASLGKGISGFAIWAEVVNGRCACLQGVIMPHTACAVLLAGLMCVRRATLSWTGCRSSCPASNGSEATRSRSSCWCVLRQQYRPVPAWRLDPGAVQLHSHWRPRRCAVAHAPGQSPSAQLGQIVLERCLSLCRELAAVAALQENSCPHALVATQLGTCH